MPAFYTKAMDNPLPGAHAALMCIAFVFIFPFGAVVMQFLKKALWHAAAQIVGFVMVISGFGVAVSFSKQYNKVSISIVDLIQTLAFNNHVVKRFQIGSPSYWPASNCRTDHTAWARPCTPLYVYANSEADTNGPNSLLPWPFHHAIRDNKWWHRIEFCRRVPKQTHEDIN